MNALTAPIQHIEPSEILFAIPLATLTAAVVNGLFGDRIAAGRGPRATHAVAFGSVVIALATIVWSLYRLQELPADRRFLLQHLWSFLRVGSLSASFDLAADPLSTSLALLVLVLALVAHLEVYAREERPVVHARVSLLAGGLSLALLGEGFVPLLIGLGLSTVGNALLLGREQAGRRMVLGHVGDAALLAGAVVMFWALGGGFGIAIGNEPTFTRHNPIPGGMPRDPEGLDETLGPQLLPIIAAAGNAPPAIVSPKPSAPLDFGSKGKISLPSWSGAKIHLRGGSAPAAIAPVIGVEAYAGRIDIEVERTGMPHAMLHAVDVPANGELQLVPLGPTLSFRELYDQLALTDFNHKRFVRELIDRALPQHRRIFGVSAVSAAALLFAIAALARGLPLVDEGEKPSSEHADRANELRAVAVVLAPLPAVYLLARLAPVFSLASSAVTAATMTLAVLFAFVAAGIASARASATGAIRAAIAAQGALALAGAAAGGGGAAVLHVMVFALAGCALLLIHQLPFGPGKSRVSLIATLAFAAAPLPLLGVAWSREALLQRVFAADAPFHLGQLGWLLCAASVALIAHAAMRVHLEQAAADEGENDLPSELRNAIFLLPVIACVLGVVLVISRAGIGLGPQHPLFESWLALDLERIVGEGRVSRSEVGRATELAIGIVSLLATILAARAATRSRKPLPLARLEAIPRALAALGSGFVEGIGAVAHFVELVLELPLRIVFARRRP